MRRKGLPYFGTWQRGEESGILRGTPAEAKASLDTVRVANTQLARLLLPADVPGQGRGGSWFNTGGVLESNFIVNQGVLS